MYSATTDRDDIQSAVLINLFKYKKQKITEYQQ
jgi:hypothetical protein